MTTRRAFLGGAGAIAAATACGCRTRGARLWDGEVNSPNYWCTWATQGATVEGYKASGEIKFPGDQGVVGIRENLNEQVLFRQGAGWAHALYPESREDLNLLLDDGWDVGFGFNPYANCDRFGSMILHGERFPSFPGTPAQRLKRLVRVVKDCGWRGLGLWVAPQMPGESWCHREPDERAYEDLKRKLGWCGEAGVAYLKVDWGSRDGDVEYRRRMSELARELAPGMLVEHCRTWGVPMNGVKLVKENGRDVVAATTGRCEGDAGFDERVAGHAEELLKFSDAFRIYDMTEPIFHTQALERTQVLMRLAEKVGGRAYINVEDTPYLAATLGASMGVMRAPIWPKRGEDVAGRRERTGEVVRAIAWQRLAPPFRSDPRHPTLRSEATLRDEWTFRAGDTWYPGVIGRTIPQLAPAVTTRGLGGLVQVVDAGEGVPFVTAMRHPNGALAVGALPRTVNGVGLKRPAAAVHLPVPLDRGVPLGVFGTFASVSVELPRNPGNLRVTAADMACGVGHDITIACKVESGRLTLPGATLAKIGREAADDRSDPATLVLLDW